MNILDIAMNSLAANAKKVEISVRESRKHDRLVLRVRDDGRGMDTAAVSRAGDGRAGLAGMRERLMGLGGRLEVRSAPGQGVHLEARMPVESAHGN